MRCSIACVTPPSVSARPTVAFAPALVGGSSPPHWLSTAEAISSFSAPLPGRRISPRKIVEFLAHTADTLGLPHPLHLHVNQLGVPGNIDVTIETSRALSGLRHHLAHVQFHAYAADESGDFISGAAQFI